MKLIPLSTTLKTKNSKYHGTFFAKVSDEDFEWLSQWSWVVCCSRGRYFYAQRNEWDKYKKRQRKIKMHRLILGVTDPKIAVDHKDHDGLNNQRDNLRAGTYQQNSFNKRPYGASKYIGINLHHDKWRGRVKKGVKSVYTARFDNEKDAAMARDIIAKELHGEFANLNFK